MKCLICGLELEGKKEGTKYCSPKCRKAASRLNSVTHNVTLTEPDVTDIWFEYKTVQYDLNLSQDKRKPKWTTKKARYWYEVPISAIPVIRKGWPPCPEFMNGRQYFLWWKNEFEMTDKGPRILNPNRSSL